MVQCMEAWLLADPEALAGYYKRGFRGRSLPIQPDLEVAPKLRVYDELAKATRGTSKGEYAKIRHASALLALIDPEQVAARYPRFGTFTTWLSHKIARA
jgi:hypothetical protein